MESEDIPRTPLNLDTRCRWVILRLRVLYSRIKSPCLGGRQGRSELSAEQRIPLPVPGIERRFLGSLPRSFATISTELSPLPL